MFTGLSFPPGFLITYPTRVSNYIAPVAPQKKCHRSEKPQKSRESCLKTISANYFLESDFSEI